MFEAQCLGGKSRLEQVIQTQLTLPKSFANSKFKGDFVVYFNVDSAGKGSDLKFEGQISPVFQKEMGRIVTFLEFKPTLNLPNEPRPYFLKFSIGADNYKKYIKQKSKFNVKFVLPSDSSMLIYSRADRSPEFYNNGEEGYNRFVLSELDYPKLAIEKSISGTVVLEFVVETNGFVTHIEVKKSVNAGCTEEAIRLISMSRWKPAELNGKYVRYKTTSSITFSLRNVNRNNESSGSTFGQ